MDEVDTELKFNINHPFKVFNEKLTFADSLSYGQDVYISTIAPATYSIKPINWMPNLNLPMDFMVYTFKTFIANVNQLPYIVDPLFIEYFSPIFKVRIGLSRGSSGSPVFDENGNLVGMIITTDGINFSHALTSEVLKNFLQIK